MIIHLLGHLTNNRVAVRIELHSQNYFGVITMEEFARARASEIKNAVSAG